MDSPAAAESSIPSSVEAVKVNEVVQETSSAPAVLPSQESVTASDAPPPQQQQQEEQVHIDTALSADKETDAAAAKKDEVAGTTVEATEEEEEYSLELGNRGNVSRVSLAVEIHELHTMYKLSLVDDNDRHLQLSLPLFNIIAEETPIDIHLPDSFPNVPPIIKIPVCWSS